MHRLILLTILLACVVRVWGEETAPGLVIANDRAPYHAYTTALHLSFRLTTPEAQAAVQDAPWIALHLETLTHGLQRWFSGTLPTVGACYGVQVVSVAPTLEAHHAVEMRFVPVPCLETPQRLVPCSREGMSVKLSCVNGQCLEPACFAPHPEDTGPRKLEEGK